MNSFNAEEGIFNSGSQTKSSRKYMSPTVETLDAGVSILTTIHPIHWHSITC